MLPEGSKSLPSFDWTLGDWIEAVGSPKNSEIADLASRMGLAQEDKPWSEQTIRIWCNGASRGDKRGIRERPAAIAMIGVLREIARQRRASIFNNENIVEHSRIFLRSKACRHMFADLEVSEFRRIAPQMPFDEITEEYSLVDLRSRVQPAPPHKSHFFGREHDIERVLQALQDHHVTMINGVAGYGKTALAWIASVEAWETGRFTNIDWTTDKRYTIDLKGQAHVLGGSESSEDFFERILTNMVKRFGWNNLLGVQSEKLINRCADQLRAGRYLVVIDNLETVQQNDALVRQLLDLLTPIRSKEQVVSRALISSREQSAAECGDVHIAGINKSAIVPYIRYLENLWKSPSPLTDVQCSKLSTLTDGNPLLLQIAVRQLILQPTYTAFEILENNLGMGTHLVFDSLFRSLIDKLSQSSVELARWAAQYSSLTTNAISETELFEIWQRIPKIGNDGESFHECFNELIQNLVFSSNFQDQYAMHPLIRAYFLR